MARRLTPHATDWGIGQPRDTENVASSSTLAMVLLSLALFEAACRMWLCPFTAVSEYQTFVVLLAGLIVVLPLLTKKRTQCAFFCPFGVFQSIFRKSACSM